VSKLYETLWQKVFYTELMKHIYSSVKHCGGITGCGSAYDISLIILTTELHSVLHRVDEVYLFLCETL